MTELELFMSKVDTTNDCWAWTGVIDGKGYGKFTIKRKQLIASRYAYKAFVGDIPNGLFVLHKCDVRNCVNPEHLQLVSESENSAKTVRVLKYKTHCKWGHKLENNIYKFNSKQGERSACATCANKPAKAGI